MSKNADHADLIERLRYPDDSIAVRLEAADLLEWQAREAPAPGAPRRRAGNRNQESQGAARRL